MVIQMRVLSPVGEEMIIDVCKSQEELKQTTVLDLKKDIAKASRTNYGDIQLVYKTQVLGQDTLVVSHGLKHMSTINTIVNLPGGI